MIGPGRGFGLFNLLAGSGIVAAGLGASLHRTFRQRFNTLMRLGIVTIGASWIWEGAWALDTGGVRPDVRAFSLQVPEGVGLTLFIAGMLIAVHQGRWKTSPPSLGDAPRDVQVAAADARLKRLDRNLGLARLAFWAGLAVFVSLLWPLLRGSGELHSRHATETTLSTLLGSGMPMALLLVLARRAIQDMRNDRMAQAREVAALDGGDPQ